uniref:Aminoglycoside phosphotransferase domain-containing protein n=1 Tax=Cereibacter sphaeroides (strain ATCC 17025 / ATH 2.4.3) TaxID=349102 RepID=A4WYL3_CERS5
MGRAPAGAPASPEAGPPAEDAAACLARLPGLERVIETHLARVFLFPDRVLKMKRPLQTATQDLRLLPARHRACAAEVRLNRELAGPEVYRGLLPVVRTASGLRLDGRGEVVEWLVHMRRLPSDRMLDRLILEGRGPGPAEIEALGRRLAGFWRTTRGAPKGAYFRHLLHEAAIDGGHLAAMAGHVPGADIAGLSAALVHRLKGGRREIARREALGFVREGHGDLRPEHVCLTLPPVLFDRVEFARDFRLADAHDEVAFLGQECALLGRPDIAPRLVRHLEGAGFPPPSRGLLKTFRLHHCLTRARLALDHLLDPACSDPAKFRERARVRLELAARLLG